MSSTTGDNGTDAATFDTSVLIRLLDHQIVDENGRFLGKVDDLLLREDGEDLLVEALMVGPTALAPRYPGVLGRWGWAIWRRLSDPGNPGAVLVPVDEVLRVRSDVLVSAAARDALLASFGLENWLRMHLIERIPGARGAGHRTSDDVDVPAWASPDGPPVPPLRDTGDRHRLTELMRMRVLDRDGAPIGRITDVEGCVVRGGDHLGPLRLTRVLLEPRGLGSGLGYSTPDQDGPLVINRIVRAAHRSARWHAWSDIAGISWREGTIRIDEGG